MNAIVLIIDTLIAFDSVNYKILTCFSPFSRKGEDIPGPLPLGVAVIDSSIKLFGLVFPIVALKHRNQLLAHFCECIKHAKSSRQQAIQTNILTAFLCALKVLC